MKKDGLSFLMIINKIKSSEAFNSINLPREYLDNLSANSPEDVLDVLARVVAVLLRKQYVPEDEIQNFVSQIKERHMSDLFEGFKGINVIEERRIGQDILLISQVCKKLVKGKDVYTIAAELELDDEIDKIKQIADIAAKYAGNYDADKIYDELSKLDAFVEN